MDDGLELQTDAPLPCSWSFCSSETIVNPRKIIIKNRMLHFVLQLIKTVIRQMDRHMWPLRRCRGCSTAAALRLCVVVVMSSSSVVVVVASLGQQMKSFIFYIQTNRFEERVLQIVLCGGPSSSPRFTVVLGCMLKWSDDAPGNVNAHWLPIR